MDEKMPEYEGCLDRALQERVKALEAELVDRVPRSRYEVCCDQYNEAEKARKSAVARAEAMQRVVDAAKAWHVEWAKPRPAEEDFDAADNLSYALAALAPAKPGEEESVK